LVPDVEPYEYPNEDKTMRTIISSTTVSPLLRRILAVSALGFCLAGVAGCGSTVDPSETAASAEGTPAPAAQAVATVRTRSPGGFFLNAIDTASLRPDQKVTIDNLRASLTTQFAPVRAARAKLGAELAQQVRSGTLDHARTDALLAQVQAAAAATKPAVQLAVQQVHDTLDATQRQALVDSLPARGDHAGHRAAMKAHMDKVAAELSLTDDQRTAIHAAMKAAFVARGETMKADHTQMKARMQAITTAFASDTFDAVALGVGEHGGAMANHFGGMHGAFLDAAVPLLTSAQRAILATKIQNRSQAAATTVEPAEADEAAEE
jgi:Spy/CpxP family protein refolding chaperone